MGNSLKTRDVGLDLAKVTACIFVVMMHTFRNVDSNVTNVIPVYYLTRCSMPIFFMCVGYIQLEREADYVYSIKKIRNILFVGFGWSILVGVCQVMKAEPFVVGVKTILGWPVGSGTLGQFWFLGTMIIVYIILIPLKKLNKKYYPFFTVILIMICAGIDFVNVIRINNGATSFIQEGIRQCFRLWTWLTYVMLGAVVRKLKGKIAIWKLVSLSVILSIIAITWMYYWSYFRSGVINGEYSYDSLFVMIWSAVIFLLFVSIEYRNKRIPYVNTIMHL